MVQRTSAHPHQHVSRPNHRLRAFPVLQNRRITVLLNDDRFHKRLPTHVSVLTKLILPTPVTCLASFVGSRTARAEVLSNRNRSPPVRQLTRTLTPRTLMPWTYSRKSCACGALASAPLSLQ